MSQLYAGWLEASPYEFIAIRYVRATKTKHTCHYCSKDIPVGEPCVRYAAKHKGGDFKCTFGCAACERST